MLWGAIVIEEYAYRCVLSNAKIGLMICDLPRVDYKKEKKEYKLTQKDYDECVVANKELDRKYQESLKGEPINLTELIQSA